MENKIDIFSESEIEALAKVLSECGTGSDISRILYNKNIKDNSGESTKWRRLYSTFIEQQNITHSPNSILSFIISILSPTRFINESEKFENHISELNKILSFHGLEYGKDSKFRMVKPVLTIDEAEKRVNTLKSKFHGRPIHPEVIKYCKKELMQNNYFHSVFEASKGLAQRIRDLSGVKEDGAKLIDTVFAIEKPILAINSLQTETEKSEHKGYAALLKGCFGAVRNPLAHEPKILWQGEDDAADYMTLISLLHRKLDNCIKTGY